MGTRNETKLEGCCQHEESWSKGVEPVAAGDSIVVFSRGACHDPTGRQLKRNSKMEKKSGFGRIFAVTAITFALVAGVGFSSDVAYSADTPKDKAADVKATLTDKKAKASETDVVKPGEKAAQAVNPTELLTKGAQTFIEGAQLATTNKDKAAGEKMMLEGHKMMAETETAWSKTKKELSPAQKTISEGHAQMMKGYTLIKGEKEADQGSKMVTDGYKKLTEGLKSLQAPVNGKDKK